MVQALDDRPLLGHFLLALQLGFHCRLQEDHKADIRLQISNRVRLAENETAKLLQDLSQLGVAAGVLGPAPCLPRPCPLLCPELSATWPGQGRLVVPLELLQLQASSQEL